MALKPGTKEFEQFRKKNFNLGVKVPQSAIDKLMKGGTPSANIKKYAGTNNAVMREAMNRFYGKGWEKKAPGLGGKSGGNSGNGGTKSGPVSPRIAETTKPKYGTNAPSARAIEGRNGYTAPKKANTPAAKQKKLNDFMRSPDYRPTTSIGSFNPNAQVSPKDFSFSKLNARQRAEFNTALSFLLLPGVGGLGVKAGLAATKALRIANVARIGDKGVKLLEAGKTVKGIDKARKALIKAEKLAKDPKAIADLKKAKTALNKIEKGLSKSTKATPKGALKVTPKRPSAAIKSTKATVRKTTKPAAKKTVAKKTAKGPRGYNDVRKAMSDGAKKRGKK
jgi:hypothetical protein